MSALSLALTDIVSGAKNWRLWSTLALEDLRQRFRRTVIGILWVAITFGLFIGAKVLIFGDLMAVDDKNVYAIYVTLGFLAWQFIVASVNDGCNVFVTAENWVKGVNTPLSLFIYQSIARNFITFFYSALAAALIIILMGHPATLRTLMVIPALLVYILNAIWISLVFGVLAARYRDVMHLVSTAMKIIFFLTPILWMPTLLSPGIRKYAEYNPFTHYLAIFREPILYHNYAWKSWVIVLSITLAGWLVGLTVFSKCRKRIVFWL